MELSHGLESINANYPLEVKKSKLDPPRAYQDAMNQLQTIFDLITENKLSSLNGDG
jgi:hypothetical protein